MALRGLAPPGHVLELDTGLVLHQLAFKNDFIVSDIVEPFGQGPWYVEDVDRDIDWNLGSDGVDFISIELSQPHVLVFRVLGSQLVDLAILLAFLSI
jgi:hypothetical protein